MEETSDGLHEKQKHGRRYGRRYGYGSGWTALGCIDSNNNYSKWLIQYLILTFLHGRYDSD